MSPQDRVSPPPKDPKDNGECNGSDHGDSPRGRETRSPSDGYRSPAAKERSPSPRDNDNERSPSPRGSGSPSPRDNGNGDGDSRLGSGSPRGSESP